MQTLILSDHVAQLVSASACQAEGRGFKSRHGRKKRLPEKW